MSFELLSRQHQQLERLRSALLSAVRGEPDARSAFSLLAEFSVLIEEHRAAEQRHVYEPLIRLSKTKDIALNFELSTLVIEMEHDWGAYLHDWDAESIEGDWASFAQQTEYMLARGGARLRLEESVIYPLALREGTMPLKERPR